MIARVASRRAGYGVGPDDVARFADEGCRLLVTGDCGTSDHEALALCSRARRRRDRDRPPPGAVGGDARRSRSSTRTGPTIASRSRGSPRAAWRSTWRPRCAPAWRRRRPPSTRATCWIWWRSARSPTWCRSSTRTGSWSPPVCAIASARKRPGLRALAALAELEPEDAITADDVSFRLAPRLNAAGRLGEAQLALDLLLAPDDATADRLAAELDERNRQRQRIQEQVWTEAP